MPEPETVHVAHVSEFHGNSRKLIKFGATRNIAIIHHEGQFYAMDNACYHHGGPLLNGDIEDLGGHPCIVCPWHNYKIALDTGEGFYIGVEIDPAGGRPQQSVRSKGPKQRVHSVRVEEDGNVYLTVDLSGPAWESDRYAEMALANQEMTMKSAIVSTGPGPRMHSGLGSELRSGHVFQSFGCGRSGLNPLNPSPVVDPEPMISPTTADKSRTLLVSCCRVTNVCHDVKAFHFVRESGRIQRLGELGEYVELELPLRNPDGTPVVRRWTICEAHTKNTLFTVMVKAHRENPQGGSVWMHTYGLHSILKLRRVGGCFTLVDYVPRIRALQGQILWMTAGIAITSAYANLSSSFGDDYFMQSTTEQMHVAHIHADRERRGVAKLEAFVEWELQLSTLHSTHRNKTYGMRLFLTKEVAPDVPTDRTVIPRVTYGRRPDQQDVKTLIETEFCHTPFLAFVCGPPTFVVECTRILLALGVQAADIITDDTQQS